MTYPACFNSQEDWDGWRLIARKTYIDKRAGYCIDCTASYQARMVEEGRCEKPDIIFRIDSDGMLEGRMPYIKRAYVSKRGKTAKEEA